MLKLSRPLLARLAVFLCLGGGALLLAGCQTPQAGVKSMLGRQYTVVDASVEETTEAAAAVLEELGLQEVTAASTAFDGEVAGFTRDRTRVEVYTAMEDQTKTEVSAMVGALGDAALGTEIISKIQARLSP